MEKRVNIFKILRDEKKLSKILIYPGKEIVLDPFEKNKGITLGQYLTIEALVRDISPEALVWKYYGQIPMGSKELICQKKYKLTLLAADKIQIGEKFYKTRKDDSKGFAMLERQDYIIVFVELKNNGS